jgi:hypothetical protein
MVSLDGTSGNAPTPNDRESAVLLDEDTGADSRSASILLAESVAAGGA